VKKSKFISILLLVVLLFTSCGKSEIKEEKKEPQINGVITLQMRSGGVFNPLAVTNHNDRDIYSLCYEPLFTVGSEIEPVGVLAQGITISDDCMNAVVTLKDSVLWHDGISLTSNDVAYTIKLLKENGQWEYFGCIKYIDTVEIIDNLTFRINLTRPYAQITYSLTFPIVAEHNRELDSKIIGTGPYRFSAYTPETTLELIKNDSWHGGEVNCDKVNINIIKDDTAVTTAFNAGLLSAVTDESFDTENYSPKAGTKMYSYPSTEFEYMVLNQAPEGLFASQNIRSAISYAIDRSAIVNECYNGKATETNSPVHPLSRDVSETSIQSQYSIANSSEMLFLEGYTLDENSGLLKNSDGESFRFELLVNDENFSRIKTADLIAKQLFAVGIDVKVKILPFEEYVEKIINGEYDAYLGGTRLGNFYDFEPILSYGGTLNNYGYSGENIAPALDVLNTALGKDRLSDAIFNFEEVFLREQPIVGILFKNRTLLTSDSVSGNINPGVNNPYKDIYCWSVPK